MQKPALCLLAIDSPAWPIYPQLYAPEPSLPGLSESLTRSLPASCCVLPQYTIFGKVTKGMDVLHKLEGLPTKRDVGGSQH